MTTTKTTYQGWANYATWNVWLWLTNEPAQYYAMAEYLRGTEAPNYEGLIDTLRAEGVIDRETPDGVYWYSPDISKMQIKEAMLEMQGEDWIRPS